MNFYPFFVIVVVAIAGCSNWQKKYIFIFSLLISMVAAFYVVNLDNHPDAATYEYLYGQAPNIIDILYYPKLLGSVYGEYGYTIVASVMHSAGLAFIVFQFLVVFAALLLKLYVLREISNSYFYAVFLYFILFFYFDSFVLRQSLAAGFIAIAIYFLFLGNSIRFIFFSVIASLFHISALCVFPLLFLYKIRLSVFLSVFLVFLALLFGYLEIGLNVVEIIMNYFEAEYIGNKLSKYMVSAQGESLGLFRGSVFIYTILLVMYIVMRPWLVDKLTYYNSILVVCLYSYFILVGFSFIGVLGDRLFRLYGVFFCAAFSSFGSVVNRKGLHLFNFMYYVFLVFVLFYKFNLLSGI